MCRWIAYSGQPIFMEQLVTSPAHSLVEQSMNTKMNYGVDGNLWTTNGDGSGIGWYADRDRPGIYKDARPAWNDENLHEICAQVEARIFFAHIRATTTGAVQRSNSHPFKNGKWLFQHNGEVEHFPTVRRDLQIDIAPELYPDLKGTTDSETFFLLALTYGLDKNPKEALQKMVQRVEKACVDNKIDILLNLSCALSDGKTVYTFRYAKGCEPNTQFYSTKQGCIRDFNNECTILPQNSVIVVSEPLDPLSDQWIGVPENSFVTIRDGDVVVEDFMA